MSLAAGLRDLRNKRRESRAQARLPGPSRQTEKDQASKPLTWQRQDFGKCPDTEVWTRAAPRVACSCPEAAVCKKSGGVSGQGWRQVSFGALSLDPNTNPEGLEAEPNRRFYRDVSGARADGIGLDAPHQQSPSGSGLVLWTVIGSESWFLGVVVRGGHTQGEIQALERQVLERSRALDNDT